VKTRRACWQILSLAFFFSLTWVLAAAADTIRLKNGRVIKGEVVRFRNGEFVVRLARTDAHTGRRDQMILLVETVGSIEFDTTSTGPARRRQGVTLYKHEGYRGASEVFYDSDADLRDNRIGNDRASSIRVPPGYIVTLWEHTNFRGRSVVLRNDESKLSRTPMGNDVVSSIRVQRVGDQR
jgi:hypothetical protein